MTLNLNEMVQHITLRRFARRSQKKLLFSRPIRLKLRQLYGKRLLPFFDLYTHLRDVYEGDAQPPEKGFSKTFREYALMFRRKLEQERSQKAFRDLIPQMVQQFKRIDRTEKRSGFLYADLITMYARMIDIAAKDKDLFLVQRKLKYPGFVRFIKAGPDQEKMLRIERDNPELYEMMKREKEIQKQLDKRIEQEVRRSGMEPGTTKINGKLVVTGTDPKTKEKFVYDRDGEVVPIAEYADKLEQQREEVAHLKRVQPEDLDDLKSYPEGLIAKYVDSREIEYVAITDDTAKQDETTRIYPVMELFGDRVVTEGRFKGFSLPDVVNRTGRMIEGAAYDYDEKLGRPIKIETRKNGELNVNLHKNREPYMTRDKEDLYLKIPSSRDYTEVRNAMRDLSEVSPDIEYVKGTRQTAFRFDPEEFSSVREALRSVAMSKSAMEMVTNHFEEIAKSELAVQKENLVHYKNDKLGGFKEDAPELYVKQKQSLAWLDSRGGNGLVALGTGVGKTSLALGYVQNMIRDGLLEGNKKVLFVCPAKLKGNLRGEARDWMKDNDAFMDNIEEMSYAQLSRSEPNVLDQYEAVIFDEAQHLKNVGSTKRGKIVNRNHPRKVLMTASPMERDPAEVRKLAAIANNEDMRSPEGREKLRMFEKRYCEKIGSRTVGVKNDPKTQKNMRTWIKQNLFFGHKQDVEEVALPQLRRVVKSLEMPMAMEEEYRKRTEGIRDQLDGLVSLYRDKDQNANDPEITGALVSLRSEIGELQKLSNMPDAIFPWMSNPKIDTASDIIEERIESRGRTLNWTSSSEFAEHTGKELSKKYPGTKHAVGVSDEIQVWRSGRKIESYTKRTYYKPEGDKVDPDMWAKHVIDTFIKTDNNIISCTLTDPYSTGQNLQQFDTVIHLDRADNAETGKQRTARAYRNGQKNSVTEHTLDAVYSEEASEAEATIDDIRRFIQEMEEDLFNEVVIQSQKEKLGEEFYSMDQVDASIFDTERKTLELLMSPYMEELRDHYGVDPNPATSKN